MLAIDGISSFFIVDSVVFLVLRCQGSNGVITL